MANKIEGDLVITGDLRVSGSIQKSIDGNSFKDSGVPAEASALKHQFNAIYSKTGTAAADTGTITHVCGEDGTIVEFKAMLDTACTGNATVTVDLQKGGVSVLSAAISLGSGDAADTFKTATISSAAVLEADVLKVVVTVNAGTGALGTGLTALTKIREAP